MNVEGDHLSRGGAEEAIAAVRTLVELSTEQLEICSQASEELELSGEVKKVFLKRLVLIQSEIRKARSTIKQLAAAPLTPQTEPGQ